MTLEEIIAAHVAGDRSFKVEGYEGIAFRLHGVEMIDDEETEWTGYQVQSGRVVMVMVGDDHRFRLDPEDVQVIAEEDYCHECGQIGCKADGRDS